MAAQTPRLKDLTPEEAVALVRQKVVSHGGKGIISLGRAFRRHDDDGSKALNMEEFTEALQEYGLKLQNHTVKQLFAIFDKDGQGSINFDEFLLAVRPPIDDRRRVLIEKAFQLMDKSGDGKITVEDLRGVYDVRSHKKYQNGEYTRDQVLREFLDNFDSAEKDGVVTLDEFTNYYTCISASCDTYAYFELVMIQAFKGLQL